MGWKHYQTIAPPPPPPQKKREREPQVGRELWLSLSLSLPGIPHALCYSLSPASELPA